MSALNVITPSPFMSEVAPRPRPALLDIAAYVPGRSGEPGPVRPHKLSSNENPLGPSPAAREAFLAAANGLDRYPEGGAPSLRAAIADAYGLRADCIVCGNGSDELLALLASAYLSPGDEAVFSEHAFLVYRIAVQAAGGVPVVAPESGLRVDVDAMLAAVTERTRLVFLANPNNPTGSYTPATEVRRLREGLPPHVLLVLDAAYAEYVRRNDYESGIELVATRQDTVMTRTFSKIHGLAALRIGWMYAPPAVTDVLHRIRAPFNVNAPAIAAGIAALADRAHVARSADHNSFWLPRLRERILEMGYGAPESVGNFLLIDFGAMPGADAAAADAFLSARGIVLRSVASYGLPQMLRMSVGTQEANEATLAALAAYTQSVRGG